MNEKKTDDQGDVNNLFADLSKFDFVAERRRRDVKALSELEVTSLPGNLKRVTTIRVARQLKNIARQIDQELGRPRMRKSYQLIMIEKYDFARLFVSAPVIGIPTC